MKIFLEAFIDTNFGDNLFVHTVVSRYSEHQFYMLPKKGYEDSYRNLIKQENNIYLLDEDSEQDFIKKMDAMIVVGGDMLWEGTYRIWRKYIRVLKRKNAPVIFMGMSLFPNYSKKTKIFLRLLFHKINVIVVRESMSYAQAKKIAPRANVISATDMAFTSDLSEVRKINEENGVLGVSVRKKIPRNTKDAYAQYCENIAKVAESYLKKDPNNKVRFLALSKGVYDDEAVAQDIIGKCSEDNRHRIECVSFAGDVNSYIEDMQKCQRMICTRFHALVFAILLDKPFVPIIYEEKMDRLLNEIAYTGIRLRYEDFLDSDEIWKGFLERNIGHGALCQYLKKADVFFKEVDRILDNAYTEN